MATATTADSLISVDYVDHDFLTTSSYSLETLPSNIYAELTLYSVAASNADGFTVGGHGVYIQDDSSNSLFTFYDVTANGSPFSYVTPILSALDTADLHSGPFGLTVIIPPGADLNIIKAAAAGPTGHIRYQIKKFAQP